MPSASAWIAKKCGTPITDISKLRSKIKFESGAGITAKKGALGMSRLLPATVLVVLPLARCWVGNGSSVRGVDEPGALRPELRSAALAIVDFADQALFLAKRPPIFSPMRCPSASSGFGWR